MSSANLFLCFSCKSPAICGATAWGGLSCLALSVSRHSLLSSAASWKIVSVSLTKQWQDSMPRQSERKRGGREKRRPKRTPLCLVIYKLCHQGHQIGVAGPHKCIVSKCRITEKVDSAYYSLSFKPLLCTYCLCWFVISSGWVGCAFFFNVCSIRYAHKHFTIHYTCIIMYLTNKSWTW